MLIEKIKKGLASLEQKKRERQVRRLQQLRKQKIKIQGKANIYEAEAKERTAIQSAQARIQKSRPPLFGGLQKVGGRLHKFGTGLNQGLGKVMVTEKPKPIVRYDIITGLPIKPITPIAKPKTKKHRKRKKTSKRRKIYFEYR